MSFVSLQAKLMTDEKRESKLRQARLRAKMMPKRNYTNFSGNYGYSDDAWEKYLKSIEKYRNMNAW